MSPTTLNLGNLSQFGPKHEDIGVHRRVQLSPVSTKNTIKGPAHSILRAGPFSFLVLSIAPVIEKPISLEDC